MARTGRPPKTERDEEIVKAVYRLRFAEGRTREVACELVAERLLGSSSKDQNVRRVVRELKGSARLLLHAEEACELLDAGVPDPPLSGAAANKHREQSERFEEWEAGGKAAQEKNKRAIEDCALRAKENEAGRLLPERRRCHDAALDLRTGIATKLNDS